METRRCLLCLGLYHRAEQCDSAACCRLCGSKHNTMLHRRAPASPPQTQEREEVPPSIHHNLLMGFSCMVKGSENPAPSSFDPSAIKAKQFYTAFFQVLVKSSQVFIPITGGLVRVNALIDTSANGSAVSKWLADRLMLDEQTEFHNMEVASGEVRTQSTKLCHLQRRTSAQHCRSCIPSSLWLNAGPR